MNIIFEGARRVGKSSVIKAFLERHPEYQGHYKRDLTPHQMSIELQFLFFQNQPTVYDRLHVSDMVYTPYYRPDNIHNLYWQELMRTEPKSTAMSTVIIYIPTLVPEIMKTPDRPTPTLREEIDWFNHYLRLTRYPVINLPTQRVVPRGWRHMDEILSHLESALEIYK